MALGRRAKLGIIFAIPEERAGLEGLLAQTNKHRQIEDGFSLWPVGNIDLMLAVSGAGYKAAASTARSLADKGARSIISAGLAAGLAPEAGVGDIITADCVYYWDEGRHREISTNPRITSALPPNGTLGIRIRECALVTSDVVIASTQQKQELYRTTGAAAVDMESYAIGEVCSASGIPFAAVRAISDSAEEDLPPQVEMLLNRSKIGRAVVIMAHPNIIPALFRLHSQSHRAITNLSEVLATLILRLI